ncbi:MAG: hypothetical protein HYZ81_26670 [Nitrospinae bacterium]|nr:hypothetical protein [Nitrospinota bacterium]
MIRRKAKGEQQRARMEAEAEACFQRAPEVARRQEAKSLELRAATRLSRLWYAQGRHEDARQLLADIYGWFSEGFATPDLQEARLLLDQLARTRGIMGESLLR